MEYQLTNYQCVTYELYRLHLYCSPKILKVKIDQIEAEIADIANSYGENRQRKAERFLPKYWARIQIQSI